MINMMLFKAKITHMAESRKLQIAGLLARAIYLSAAELLPEDTFYQKKHKYHTLEDLQRKCFSMSVKLTEKEKENQPNVLFSLDFCYFVLSLCSLVLLSYLSTLLLYLFSLLCCF